MKVPEMAENPPSSHIHLVVHRNQWLFIIVCIIGIMITSTWLAFTPDNLMGKMDAVGYAVCHRIPSHSLSVDGRPLPLCARCSGMYLGALYGLIFQVVFGKRRGGFSGKLLVFLGVFALFFALDGINSFAGLVLDRSPFYDPQNWLRLVTGVGVGLLIAIVLHPIFTQTVWRSWQPGSALDDYRMMAIFLVGGILMMIALLSGLSVILYLLAILSVLSVLVVLTLIYSLLLLMLFKQENRYNHFRELSVALLGGFTLTMVQIGIFDLVRFFLTETWNGLPL
jgi:uncharacterized membrane protein